VSFVRGTPTWGILSGEAARIDAEVCAESSCARCGHRGMTYDPWVDSDEQRYVAFAVCPECGAKEEF
jgi:Zn ribbon nucleic-acid-binding protein